LEAGPLGPYRGEAAAVAIERGLSAGLRVPALDDDVDVPRVELEKP
jgi:hypothetical protein